MWDGEITDAEFMAWSDLQGLFLRGGRSTVLGRKDTMANSSVVVNSDCWEFAAMSLQWVLIHSTQLSICVLSLT